MHALFCRIIMERTWMCRAMVTEPVTDDTAVDFFLPLSTHWIFEDDCLAADFDNFRRKSHFV